MFVCPGVLPRGGGGIGFGGSVVRLASSAFLPSFAVSLGFTLSSFNSFPPVLGLKYFSKPFGGFSQNNFHSCKIFSKPLKKELRCKICKFLLSYKIII